MLGTSSTSWITLCPTTNINPLGPPSDVVALVHLSHVFLLNHCHQLIGFQVLEKDQPNAALQLVYRATRKDWEKDRLSSKELISQISHHQPSWV